MRTAPVDMRNGRVEIVLQKKGICDEVVAGGCKLYCETKLNKIVVFWMLLLCYQLSYGMCMCM